MTTKKIFAIVIISLSVFLAACPLLEKEPQYITEETAEVIIDSYPQLEPDIPSFLETDDESLTEVSAGLTEVPEISTEKKTETVVVTIEPPETTTEPRETEPVNVQDTTKETTAQPVQSSLTYPLLYEDAGVKITVDKQWYVGAWCYIARIDMKDYTRLKTGMAKDIYGAAETVSSFAQRYNAILTVNSDYAEGENKGVMHNGNIYGNVLCTPQAVYSQTSGNLVSGNGAALSELQNNGYTDTFNFGANDLVVNGKSVYLRKDGGKSAQRTLIDTTGVPGNIILIVTEGRYSDGVSRGLQYYEAGDLLESVGCSYGVALDGGGSSEMVWNGQILNSVTERKLTGFIYIK